MGLAALAGMPLTSRERAALRAEAQHLTASVHLGHQGVTPALVQSLDDALRTRELVKIQLSKHADETPKALASRLAAETAAQVVQVIGRTVTLYRQNPAIERTPAEPPPWRR